MKGGFVNLGKINGNKIVGNYLESVKTQMLKNKIQENSKETSKIDESKKTDTKESKQSNSVKDMTYNDYEVFIKKLFDKLIEICNDHKTNSDNKNSSILFKNNFMFCSLDNDILEDIIFTKSYYLYESLLKLSSPVNYLNDVLNENHYILYLISNDNKFYVLKKNPTEYNYLIDDGRLILYINENETDIIYSIKHDEFLKFLKLSNETIVDNKLDFSLENKNDCIHLLQYDIDIPNNQKRSFNFIQMINFVTLKFEKSSHNMLNNISNIIQMDLSFFHKNLFMEIIKKMFRVDSQLKIIDLIYNNIINVLIYSGKFKIFIEKCLVHSDNIELGEIKDHFENDKTSDIINKISSDVYEKFPDSIIKLDEKSINKIIKLEFNKNEDITQSHKLFILLFDQLRHIFSTLYKEDNIQYKFNQSKKIWNSEFFTNNENLYVYNFAKILTFKYFFLLNKYLNKQYKIYHDNLKNSKNKEKEENIQTLIIIKFLLFISKNIIYFFNIFEKNMHQIINDQYNYYIQILYPLIKNFKNPENFEKDFKLLNFHINAVNKIKTEKTNNNKPINLFYYYIDFIFECALIKSTIDILDISIDDIIKNTKNNIIKYSDLFIPYLFYYAFSLMKKHTYIFPFNKQKFILDLYNNKKKIEIINHISNLETIKNSEYFNNFLLEKQFKKSSVNIFPSGTYDNGRGDCSENVIKNVISFIDVSIKSDSYDGLTDLKSHYEREDFKKKFSDKQNNQINKINEFASLIPYLSDPNKISVFVKLFGNLQTELNEHKLYRYNDPDNYEINTRLHYLILIIIYFLGLNILQPDVFIFADMQKKYKNDMDNFIQDIFPKIFAFFKLDIDLSVNVDNDGLGSIIFNIKKSQTRLEMKCISGHSSIEIMEDLIFLPDIKHINDIQSFNSLQLLLFDVELLSIFDIVKKNIGKIKTNNIYLIKQENYDNYNFNDYNETYMSLNSIFNLANYINSDFDTSNDYLLSNLVYYFKINECIINFNIFNIFLFYIKKTIDIFIFKLNFYYKSKNHDKFYNNYDDFNNKSIDKIDPNDNVTTLSLNYYVENHEFLQSNTFNIFLISAISQCYYNHISNDEPHINFNESFYHKCYDICKYLNIYSFNYLDFNSFEFDNFIKLLKSEKIYLDIYDHYFYGINTTIKLKNIDINFYNKFINVVYKYSNNIFDIFNNYFTISNYFLKNNINDAKLLSRKSINELDFNNFNIENYYYQLDLSDNIYYKYYDSLFYKPIKNEHKYVKFILTYNKINDFIKTIYNFKYVNHLKYIDDISPEFLYIHVLLKICGFLYIKISEKIDEIKTPEKILRLLKKIYELKKKNDKSLLFYNIDEYIDKYNDEINKHPLINLVGPYVVNIINYNIDDLILKLISKYEFIDKYDDDIINEISDEILNLVLPKIDIKKYIGSFKKGNFHNLLNFTMITYLYDKYLTDEKNITTKKSLSAYLYLLLPDYINKKYFLFFYKNQMTIDYNEYKKKIIDNFDLHFNNFDSSYYKIMKNINNVILDKRIFTTFINNKFHAEINVICHLDLYSDVINKVVLNNLYYYSIMCFKNNMDFFLYIIDVIIKTTDIQSFMSKINNIVDDKHFDVGNIKNNITSLLLFNNLYYIYKNKLNYSNKSHYSIGSSFMFNFDIKLNMSQINMRENYYLIFNQLFNIFTFDTVFYADHTSYSCSLIIHKHHFNLFTVNVYDHNIIFDIMKHLFINHNINFTFLDNISTFKNMSFIYDNVIDTYISHYKKINFNLSIFDNYNIDYIFNIFNLENKILTYTQDVPFDLLNNLYICLINMSTLNTNINFINYINKINIIKSLNPSPVIDANYELIHNFSLIFYLYCIYNNITIKNINSSLYYNLYKIHKKYIGNIKYKNKINELINSYVQKNDADKDQLLLDKQTINKKITLDEQVGGINSDDVMKQKYLKYKCKYLNLKKKLKL